MPPSDGRSPVGSASPPPRSVFEKLLFAFVAIFILNSINGRKVVKSLVEQIGVDLQWDDALGENIAPAKIGVNTAIIITSSWMPSHPSTSTIEAAVNSTMERFIGLPHTAPIFISVDHFEMTNSPELQEQMNQVDEYNINLWNKYLTNPRIHIVPNTKILRADGSVTKVLSLIERHYPAVRYIYFLQHDYDFTKDVDHVALVHSLDPRVESNFILFPSGEPDTTTIKLCRNDTNKPIQLKTAAFSYCTI